MLTKRILMNISKTFSDNMTILYCVKDGTLNVRNMT